jgi:DNA-binding transcriptional LysR family regulator
MIEENGVNIQATNALPNITVAHLGYLVAAIDHPTWAAAADSLGVSQSALSQGLGELQRRLGVELFERRGRRQIQHPRAEPVIEHARRVLAQTSDLAEWARRVRSGAGGRLRIGMIDAAAVDHFGLALRRFRDSHLDIELHLQVAPSSQLLDHLRQGSIDLAICVAPDDADLEITPLLTEPLSVYAPTGFSSEAPERWGPWVSFPRGSLTRDLIEAALHDIGARFEVVAESHQPEVLREMVHLGLGWTVLPAGQAEREPNPLTPARKRPLLHRHLVAVRRPSAVPDPAAAALTSALQAVVDQT